MTLSLAKRPGANAITLVNEVLAAVDAVSVEDVQSVAATLLEVSPTLAVIGPFDPDRDFTSAVA